MTKVSMYVFDDNTTDAQKNVAFKSQVATQIVGSVKNKDFSVSPGPDWSIEIPETGVYVVKHPMATQFYAISVSPLVREMPASVRVLEASDTQITIQTLDSEGNSVWKDFRFAISKGISANSLPSDL